MIRINLLPKELQSAAKTPFILFCTVVAGVSLLSISLFVLNLLPVPALDGSRLVFVGIEAVRRRPVDQRLEAAIHGVGFLLLFGVMIWVSIDDLVRLFSSKP